METVIYKGSPLILILDDPAPIVKTTTSTVFNNSSYTLS